MVVLNLDVLENKLFIQEIINLMVKMEVQQ